MSHAPSLRQIREAIEAHARVGAADDVALASIRQDVEHMRESIRVAIDRTRDFASRGLISEAASVIEDYPDLARQADALIALPLSSASVARFLHDQFEHGIDAQWMPKPEDVDSLVRISEQASRLRPLLDALRAAALRRETIGSRLAVLKKLRDADPQNRLWLDQIDTLEREWIKRIGEMRTDPAVGREELEDAFSALSTRQWIAPVPRGLKDEIYAKVKPMRAEAAGERYAELVGQIHDAAALMDRSELERLEAAWAQVFHETGRMPDESIQASVASAFEWLGRVAEEERSQAEFAGQVDQLDRLLNAGAPVVEIERQIAILRDSGRSAPEGVVARAQAHVVSERDRMRRRHRVVLIGSLAAAAALIAGGVFAISAFARAKDRQSAAAALQALLDKDAVLEAHTLANEIRANAELASPEVNAQLAREEQALGQWNVERASIQGKLDALRAEFAASIDRARLKALLVEINSLASRARLAQERAAAEQLAQLHAEQERLRDESDAKAVDAGLAATDASLRAWPLPDRWSPTESIDLARWDAYTGVLEQARGAVDRLLRDMAGSEVQEARVKLRSEALAARVEEARGRRSELAADLAALAPGKICAPVSLESEFTDRLQEALAKHGATLRRQGLDGLFEASQGFAPAWNSIHAWREGVWPKIELALGKSVSPEEAQVVLEVLNRFRADHPNSPYRTRVEELMRRIDPGAQAPIWSAERVRAALADLFYSNLEEVPLANGDRFVYRRPSAEDRDPLHRAVENFADLVANPDRLNAFLLQGGDQLRGGTRPSPVSVAWGQLEQSLLVADPTEVQGLLLDLLERLRTMQQGELLFRARALRELATILKQSGHVPTAASQPLDDWIARCVRLWSTSLSADWALAAHAAPANIRLLRTEASAVIADFPKLAEIAETSKAERKRAKDELRPLAPIGVLLPSASAESTRELGEARPDGAVVLVVGGSAGFRFIEGQLKGNRVEVGQEVPAGPVLVFRRAGS